jgi:hypothetical protein
MSESVQLTAKLIESFAGMFISQRYDNPKPTPPFHRTAWALYSSDAPAAVVIAPRDHAKSTGLTTDYILAECLFRSSDYVILVGSTEEGASEQLGNIAEELTENDDLIREFKTKKFIKSSASDIIVEMQDGHRFRVLAKGAEQRIRGRLWKGKRPNLVVCDDMEDDEQVENPERRTKFRRWFFRAAKQALGKQGKIRVHGTILHEDSLLARLIACPTCKIRTQDVGDGPCPKCGTEKSWKHLYYKAHASFDDFSNILWPQRWTEKQLRARRQEFIEDGDSAGYSQEFLNDPQDNAESYLRRQDFLPMSDEDREADKKISVGWDFAVSKSDMANRTSYTVGGPDLQNTIHFLDFHAARLSPTVSPAEKAAGEYGWIDLMFEVDERWHPGVHFVEGGTIWKSVENTVYTEMQARGKFLNLQVLNPVKDKAVRGIPLKKRHRAGATRWNTRADGYTSAKEEMLRFTGFAAARLDDQFDSAATLVLGIEQHPAVEKEDFFTDEDFEMERGFWNRKELDNSGGRSRVTGY